MWPAAIGIGWERRTGIGVGGSVRIGRHAGVLTHIWLMATREGNETAMDESTRVWPGIPMPSLLSDAAPAFRNHDPQTSGEAGPIYSEAERAAAKADVDEPIADYARQLWHTLKATVRYLRDDVARGGSGPLLAERASMLKTDEQWQAWATICGSALSMLAGSAGDQGYGEQEARLEYQNNFVYRAG